MLNSRFAHNDLYLAFFSTLAILSTLLYRRSGGKGWLYLSFLLVGLAASSKYNGLSLVIVPLVVYILLQRKMLFKNRLATVETMFIAATLTALGYALGTPKALLWVAFYFKRAVPAILRHATYARQPGSPVGLFGQWEQLIQMLGLGVFLLLAGAVVWYAVLLARSARGKPIPSQVQLPLVGVALLALLAMDLPMLISLITSRAFTSPCCQCSLF